MKKERQAEKVKKIAVMTPKGGVGKTITATSLAYILGAEKGKKVLVIDGDAQGNTSQIFRAYDAEGSGTSELLEYYQADNSDNKNYLEDLIKPTDSENISIIAGNGYLMKTDMELLRQTERDDQITRLRDTLKEYDHLYDYCIMDCGRLLDMTVLNMIIAADMVIAPVKVGGFEARAIGELLEQMENIKAAGMNERIKVKVLLTMKQKNKTTEQVEEWLREHSGFDVLKTTIRRSIVVEKSTMGMLPLPVFSKNSIAARDYRELAEEIMEWK